MEAEPEALFAGDLVEVKSCDDGFEGCWCEAVVSKQVGRLGSKLQGDAQSTRMYSYMALLKPKIRMRILSSAASSRVRLGGHLCALRAVYTIVVPVHFMHTCPPACSIPACHLPRSHPDDRTRVDQCFRLSSSCFARASRCSKDEPRTEMPEGAAFDVMPAAASAAAAAFALLLLSLATILRALSTRVA